MLKREGTLALFVDIPLFAGDIIEGGVGLGFYRWKANTGKGNNNQLISMQCANKYEWHDRLNNIILNPKHSLQNLSGAERVETLVSVQTPAHVGGVF